MKIEELTKILDTIKPGHDFNATELYHVLSSIRKQVEGHATADDFDWDLYNVHYRGELEEISKSHTLKLAPGDYLFHDGHLINFRNVLPLHPNHRLLYETILQLAPASVIEFGCGGGDHLNNLHVLAPGLSLNGCDISGDQLELLRTRHPGLSANIFAQNITEPFGEGGPRYDVAYSQAVIMHIQTGRKHLDALENMFRAARNQVVFQENWLKHDFMGDILELRSRNRIAWEGLHFHYRISPEYGRPHQMVVSATELPAYPKLDRYDRLLEGLK